MSNILNILIENRDLLSVVLGGIIVVLITQNSLFRRVFRPLFVSVSNRLDDEKIRSELDALKAKIREIEFDASSTLTDQLRENLRHELNANASFQIQEIVDRHLADLSKRGDPVVHHLKSEVQASVQEILKNTPAIDLVRDALRMDEAENRKKRTASFDRLLDDQLNSANSTRAVMMNLFVVFNLSLLLAFAFLPERFSDRSSMTILGTYISLSAFIIYIYRASNARSASLLAVKEDGKKLSDVFDFLATFKKTPTFTNNEVELVRAMLVNRVEREKGAEHPYEVVLKGVSNSNVLVRGGKVVPSNTK